MDINSWLHELDTSRPPINTDPHVHRHQPRRKSPADSSILQYEGDRSEPRDLYQPRHTSHRHVVARRLAADERHGGHASISSATSRSAASVPHSASHPSQLYKRRPRHKTKQDRYDPKVRHVRQEPKGRHTEQKKSRSKRKSREARPESIQLEEHKPENVSGQRVTLKPSLRSGLFRQGISSLPARARTKPLDDLTFREAIFLDRNDQQKADDQTGGPKSKKPRHDQRERVIVQEQQYDDYFDQKTKFARREDCQVNRNRPQLNDELLPGRHGRQDTTETAASLPRQGTTLPTSKHRNTARASPGPPIAKLPSRSLPQHSEMSGLRIATSALERVPNVFTPPVSHLDTNAHWHDPETTSHQRHGQINRQTRPLVEYSESESSPDKMSPYWLHRPRSQQLGTSGGRQTPMDLHTATAVAERTHSRFSNHRSQTYHTISEMSSERDRRRISSTGAQPSKSHGRKPPSMPESLVRPLRPPLTMMKVTTHDAQGENTGLQTQNEQVDGAFLGQPVVHKNPIMHAPAPFYSLRSPLANLRPSLRSMPYSLLDRVDTASPHLRETSHALWSEPGKATSDVLDVADLVSILQGEDSLAQEEHEYEGPVGSAYHDSSYDGEEVANPLLGHSRAWQQDPILDERFVNFWHSSKLY